MRLSVFALSCFFCSSLQGDEEENPNSCRSSCPQGWEKMAGSCYLWPGILKTWTGAERLCIEKGGHLASVANQKIHTYTRSKKLTIWFDRWGRRRVRRTFFWVGGTDQNEEGRWRWSDGSAWNFTRWATMPNKQPNNWRGIEHCLLTYDRWAIDGWNDEDCEVRHEFVCSRPICKENKNNTNNTTTDSTTKDTSNKLPVLEVALPTGIILVCVVIVVCVSASCKYKKNRKETKTSTDVNPVYGIYQLDEAYERQYSTNEAVDNNFYYEQ